MIKRFVLFVLFVLFLVIFLFNPSMSQAANQVDLYFFYSPTCPHCADEARFLDRIENKYSELEIHRYDITRNNNIDLLKNFYDKYQVPQEEWGSTPATFIEPRGDLGKYVVGYAEPLDQPLINYIEQLISGQNNSQNEINDDSNVDGISIPFFGVVDFQGFSPLALSAIFGGLDGFNACAMVALAFLLAVLIPTGMRGRVFLIGGVFILVSGVVYYLFIAAWLNLFLFLGYLKIVTVIISVIIIFFALFLLKDYATGVVCKLCDVGLDETGFLASIQRKLFSKMNYLASSDLPLLVTLAGVALVAAGVNLVELFCSFGLPLAYTKLLSTYELSKLSYHGYLLVYILFYMLDDLLIFLAAVITLRITKIGDKYLGLVKVISGVVLLVLGLVMLFRPEILSLG